MSAYKKDLFSFGMEKDEKEMANKYYFVKIKFKPIHAVIQVKEGETIEKELSNFLDELYEDAIENIETSRIEYQEVKNNL